MDVRQGALERGGFKLLYLYNELAALRNQIYAVGLPSPHQADHHYGPLNYSLQRRNEFINVFAVCPLKSFVEETINTRELWKRKESGVAFDVMNIATASLLPSVEFEHQNAVRVALVASSGKATWVEDF